MSNLLLHVGIAALIAGVAAIITGHFIPEDSLSIIFTNGGFLTFIGGAALIV